MTRSQKNKLFGRLSTAEQQRWVAQAHERADRLQVPVWIVMDGTDGKAGLIAVLWRDADVRAADLVDPGSHVVRVIKPRVHNDIAAVYRSESRKRSAPWEGRGRHD